MSNGGHGWPHAQDRRWSSVRAHLFSVAKAPLARNVGAAGAVGDAELVIGVGRDRCALVIGDRDDRTARIGMEIAPGPCHFALATSCGMGKSRAV